MHTLWEWGSRRQNFLLFNKWSEEYGDIMTFQSLFNHNAVMVRDPVVVREVLKNVAGDGVVLRSPTLKRGFAYLSKGLLVLEGDEWRRH
eukprot:Clim_evm6s177 gene=Clim_evmTU6s177